VSLLGLVGCGGTTTPSASPSESAAATPSESAAAPDKTYIIYSDNAFAPFEFLDTATNKYTGVDMELLAAIAEDQGFKYEVKNEGFDASMGAVQAGQADGMIAGMTITEKRQATFDFSNGYFQDGQIMVVAKDSTITKPEDLKGTVVAVKTSTQGATYAESIAAQYGFTLQYYEDSPTMYTAVINGTNAACFEDFSVIGWAIKTNSLALQTAGDVVNPGEYGFAVKKGTDADLIKMFNDGLASIKANGKYDEIMTKYGY
jgi:polar amino acid transport system substrate-binding protein